MRLLALALALALSSAFGQTQINLQTQVKNVLPILNGGTGSATATGTGSVVLANNPTIAGATLSNPVISTPAITGGTITNATITNPTFPSSVTFSGSITASGGAILGYAAGSSLVLQNSAGNNSTTIANNGASGANNAAFLLTTGTGTFSVDKSGNVVVNTTQVGLQGAGGAPTAFINNAAMLQLFGGGGGSPYKGIAVGDGTGYDFAFGKISGGAFTKLWTITDSGAVTFTGDTTFNTGPTTIQKLQWSGNLAANVITTSSGIVYNMQGLTFGVQQNGNGVWSIGTTGDMQTGRSNSGGQVSATTINTSNTASSDARNIIQTGGTSAGRAYTGFYDGTNFSSIGMVSGSGNVVIANGFGFTPILTLATSGGQSILAGNIYLNGSFTNDGIIVGTGRVSDALIVGNLASGAAPLLALDYGGVNMFKIDNTGAIIVGSISFQKFTNSLGADVALNNTTLFFDGPTVAQGVVGTWFASGTVSFLGTAGSQIICKLWDGTTVIDSTQTPGGTTASLSMSGYLTTPAANIRISCKDTINTNGFLKANATGAGKDSTVTVFRIG